MFFKAIVLVSFVAALSSAQAENNCFTQGIYHSKSDASAMRYTTQTLESGVDECLSQVMNMVDWTREQFAKPLTSWSFDSASAKAYGTMQPGNGSRVMPLCSVAEYRGSYKKAQVVASTNSTVGIERCLEQAGERARALEAAGFVRFSYSAGDYVADGVIGR